MHFFVSWPAAILTESLVTNSLLSLPSVDSASIHPTLPRSFNKLVQWSTYDEIDHELTHSDHNHVLSSSFVIRKALIRKHFLSRCIRSYSTKHPDSVLRTAVPKTWEIEISFADDLDDLWADELWDLSDLLDESVASPETDGRWWVLKPGMADRGMGIRLFDSKERLRRILEEFDDDCQSGDGDGDGDGAAAPTDNTTIAISQLRHFVIQASSASLFRMIPNSNNIFRITYQVLSCLTHEKSPWVALLHGRSINCKAIRSVTFDVGCGNVDVYLTLSMI
jgi:tubulin--tyrosine ligase